ncbi:hypothetical protein B0H17DRAFT_1066884 [Mycena rosella]|uniref:Secreted protein n=1 Tax=Mycena rosella TaxID=1033263 RepID=A0AAD7DEA2_MYCRO|nr:hypothetical protein B0H17DRAFT_1066884 [Mycena rosella]
MNVFSLLLLVLVNLDQIKILPVPASSSFYQGNLTDAATIGNLILLGRIDLLSLNLHIPRHGTTLYMPSATGLFLDALGISCLPTRSQW